MNTKPKNGDYRMNGNSKKNKYSRIELGMRVLALKDKIRHIWHLGTIIRVDGRFFIRMNGIFLILIKI